ncbi:Probable cysteine desulfurase,bifunctional cysteine desulfurase/selenocysteine lyase,Kynureninase,cysteine desulfurase, SufS family,Aminotransferase class-V [Chlamydia poikilotherma]|uniref:Cysteine desulfurase n=1 Tax=Chlamydia poikilotherma TaxID=1967783 RepID=A0A3B0PYG7_9CHLA|nr:SufS family cysteine desulfurase [Chlamydia poikilotherma]SYX08545.1 Probable cysteine desulfurase,bifunctional cysteine desulfurase/selenocysteine lyase,Kynureninase,cysteine desulfurase, SufS family,Aminotransferase class-V [Chlamydia poikilotherma]
MVCRIKEDFPIFSNKKLQGESYIYLDSAATTHKPKKVIEAITDFYSSTYATVNRNIYSSSKNITEDYNAVRGKIREWIQASYNEEIVFTRGTTAALNLLAISANDIFIPEGGVVLVSEAEHHANVLSWELACRRRGSCVKKVAVDDSGYIDLEHLETLLRTGASFVSIAHVSNVTGCIQPLKQIAQLAHTYGAYIAVDGAQGVAHASVDVVDWDIDFYAFSAHKIYAPTGLGVLYGKKELLEKLPPVEGGGDMVSIYDSENPEYLPAPLKFEAGTPPIASILGLGAAIDYLQSLPDALYQQEEELTRYLYNELMTIPGMQILGPGVNQPRGALVSLKIQGAHPFDIGCLLDLQGIAVRTGHQCAQPAMSRWNLGHVLRVSLGIYNDKEDIDTFMSALQAILTRLGA